MSVAYCSLRFGAAPTVQRRPQQRPRRRVATIKAVWSAPGGSWSSWGTAQPRPEEEHWASLFAASYMPATNNPATVEDARDALETCSGLWGDQRRECLSVFGLDADQLDTYYTTVLTLEQAFQHDTDPEEEAMHRGQERC